MALDGVQMAQAVVQSLIGIPGVNIAPEVADEVWCAVCCAIVDHIKANAVVPSGIPVTVDTQTGVGSTTVGGTVT